MAADSLPENRRARDADDDALQKRLKSLDERLSSIESRRAVERSAQESAPPENRVGLAYGLRLSSEFVAGVLVGGFIGWLIDRFAGTSPWAFIVFVLLGLVAAILNLMRSANFFESDPNEGTK